VFNTECSYREIMIYLSCFKRNPAAKKELADWNLQLSGRLADVQGRVLDKELIRMVKNRELISVSK